MANYKLQSAMEYLMTYGWSILVIAIVMIAMFGLGIFGGSSSIPTACLAQSGYTCQSPVLHQNALTFAAVGQGTSISWIGVNLLWVPQGQIVPSDSAAYTWCPSYSPTNAITNTINGGISCYSITNANGALNSGQSVAPTFSFTSTVPVGSSYPGSLWVEYQTFSGGPVYQTLVAKMVLRST